MVSEEQRVLLEAYLSGTLDEDGMGAFVDALRSDEALLLEAGDAIELHGSLVELCVADRDCSALLDSVERSLVLDASSLVFEDALVAEIASRRGRRQFWGRFALVAGLLLAGLLGYQLVQPENPKVDVGGVVVPDRGKSVVVAALIARDDAVWGPSEQQFPIGHGFDAGYYELQAGSVALQTASGNLVVISAPSRFELATGEQLRLMEGRVGVRIQEGGAYRVRTPGLRIVDLGTEFGVTVTPVDQVTSLFVHEGAVGLFRESVDRASSETDGVRVVAGTGIRYSASDGQFELLGGEGDGHIRASQERNRMGIGDYGRLVLSQQPTRFWRFEDSVNGIVLCAAGGGGMRLNPAARLVDGPATGVLSLANVGLGASDMVAVADCGLLDRRIVEPPFTVSSWFRAVGKKAGPQILFGLVEPSPRGANGLQPVHVAVETSRTHCAAGMFRLRMIYRNPAGVRGGAQLISSMPIADGEWHHLVVRATSSAEVSLWVNGKLSVSTEVPKGELGSSDSVRLLIGHRSQRGGDQRTFHGQLDEIAVFNHELTDDSIQDQYRIGRKLFYTEK